MQVGDNNESNIYIEQKKKFGLEIGVEVEHKKCDVNINEDELVKIIEKYNEDSGVGGIIVQLPIPENLDCSRILNSIDVQKDVDGLGVKQIGLFYGGDKTAMVPATARGVMSLLDYYKIDLKSKNVVVIGRSNLVGRPIAQMCLNSGATVTICHSKTLYIEEHTKKADIVIVACGKPRLIGPSYLGKNQVVVDVGIQKVEGKLTGDVDFDNVKDMVSAITPVPGGVGPLTVVSLFQNLVDTQKL